MTSGMRRPLGFLRDQARLKRTTSYTKAQCAALSRRGRRSFDFTEENDPPRGWCGAGPEALGRGGLPTVRERVRDIRSWRYGSPGRC